MKNFSKIVVCTLFVFASAPAFAHGGGHAGMGGMGGTNGTTGTNGSNAPKTYNIMTYPQVHNTTPPNTTTTTTNTHNTSTKTTTTGHLSFGHKLFLEAQERALFHEINKINAEILRLKATHGPTSREVIALDRQLARLEVRFFKIKTDLGHYVVI